ncbi:hypothetical protein IGI04_018239 [Brassica rapa subsp. trilocularis]|uniref:TFIIS N-terminal domain-containing protein n=1 Tax=Brassica rapa subsp. trilocularis TaxID=1813537 RepID=A0ABQ7MDF1_BRACM|nr:hypothetical protein IGI04_018239 [Brassica rapa subsp. trilocularis]
MSQERIAETRVRARSVDNTEEVLDDLAEEPRAIPIDDKVGKKRQRNQKDESRPNKKKKKQDSVRAEIEEMWDSLTNTNTPNPNPTKAVIDRAKRKEDNDEIAKLFQVRKRKSVWQKTKAEIALQVEQVMANLELAVEDDVELNKQGQPATNKLTKLPILVGALSKKHLQAAFLDHGVLSLLKNWLEPLPDGSLPNTNVRTSVLQILDDLSIILGKGEGCRREQLVKSGLAKVVMFLSRTDEETRGNRRLANDLVNKWGHMIYERSTRFEDMLSQEEREEQEEVLSRREKKKKAREVRVGGFDEDVDFSVEEKPKVPGGRVVTVVPTATAVEFVLRPRPKVDERLKARAKMHLAGGRYENLMKRVKERKAVREQSMHALKLSVDGHSKPKY